MGTDLDVPMPTKPRTFDRTPIEPPAKIKSAGRPGTWFQGRQGQWRVDGHHDATRTALRVLPAVLAAAPRDLGHRRVAGCPKAAARQRGLWPVAVIATVCQSSVR